MSRTIHIVLKVDTDPMLLPLARALSSYASSLVEEAMGGAVISDQRKLEYGAVKMKVDVEVKDYEAEKE